jgi:pimeloyl-ACP methyl ester carboxylesterase
MCSYTLNEAKCFTGGPGGSGVFFALSAGKSIQTIVDSPYEIWEASKTGLFFDIIGFDPRGVNNSTPSTPCFPDDMSAHVWSVQGEAEGLPLTNESYAKAWGRSAALAKGCSSRRASKADGVNEIGRYMTTPTVVEDMVAIIEALGQWREEQAKKLIKEKQYAKGEAESILNRTRWMKGKEKLQYWGFSYGTILGMTFAAMHPDRVSRVAVDGVVEADDYYNGERYFPSLLEPRLNKQVLG